MEKQEEEAARSHPQEAALPPGVHPHIVPACEIDPEKTPEAWQMFASALEKKNKLLEKIKTEDGLEGLTAEIQYLKLADGCNRDKDGNIITLETEVEPLKEQCWPCPDMPVEVFYDIPGEATPEQITSIDPSAECQRRWASWQKQLHEAAIEKARKEELNKRKARRDRKKGKLYKYKVKPPPLAEIKEEEGN